MLRIPIMLLLIGTLAACTSHGNAPAPTSSTAAPASASTNALAGTPMAAYGHDLNRAKDVQNIVNQQAQKQAAEIDAATGSSSH